MSTPAIHVERLGKQVKLGLRVANQYSFSEVLMSILGAPLRRLRTLGESSYGGELFWALRDISLDVLPGEVVGLIGRNGAGKSTLLKILSRVVSPTVGRAEIRGRVGSLLEVGVGFHPELTGRENIYLNGAILGMRQAEIRRKFDEIVAFSEVERFLDTPVKRYSSGMYVRLAFAVAAHLDPEILIVDEVLAVGDVAFQRKCLGKMGDVAQGGRTVLFVSHNMRAVAGLCTRAVLMEGGTIVADGTPEAMIRKYMAGLDANVGGGPEKVFPEAAEKPAQVQRIRLYNAAARATCDYDLLDPITVEAAFTVREELDDLVAVLQVCTPTDDVVFVSTHVDEDNHWADERPGAAPRSRGNYVARATIPAPLLNCGEYHVLVQLLAPRHAVYDSVRGPVFRIDDVSSFASCLFHKPRQGHVAVPIPWELEPA
jgi:lipopolysaccharide transport system ATP-binding protein